MGDVSPGGGQAYQKSGGLNGEFGISFTPKSGKNSASYKNVLQSKKYFLKNKKRRKMKKFESDGMGDVYSAQPSNTPGLLNTPENVPANISTGKTMEHLKSFRDFVIEDASATMGNSNGMGSVVSAQPSSTPGDTQGSTVGSGDIGQNLATYSKGGVALKKKKKRFTKKS